MPEYSAPWVAGYALRFHSWEKTILQFGLVVLLVLVLGGLIKYKRRVPDDYLPKAHLRCGVRGDIAWHGMAWRWRPDLI